MTLIDLVYGNRRCDVAFRPIFHIAPPSLSTPPQAVRGAPVEVLPSGSLPKDRQLSVTQLQVCIMFDTLSQAGVIAVQESSSAVAFAVFFNGWYPWGHLVA